MASTLSHALPYVLFVAIGAAGGYLPEAWAAWADPLRALAAGGALLVFARRGAYAELKVRETDARGALWLALLAGLAAGLAWVPLAEAVPALGGRGGFDADTAGPVLWAGRLLGSILVVPFAEELFVRSLVPRYVDGDGNEAGWTAHPVGVFSPMAFAVSVLFFTLTHPEWLAALVAGVLWTLLLMATRRMRDVVLAHAVANAVLAIWVIWTGEAQWW